MRYSEKKWLTPIVLTIGGSIKGVVYDAEKTPYCDTDGVLHLQKPNALMDERETTLYIYKALHEAGHRCSPFGEWGRIMEENMEVLKKKRRLKQIWNLLEDRFQEANLLGRWRGVDQYLMQGRAYFMEDSVEAMRDKLHMEGKTKDERNTLKWVALWVWDVAARMEANPYLKTLEVGEYAKEWARKVEEEFGNANMEDSEASWEMAVRVDQFMEWEEEENEEEEEENGEGEGGEGEGEGKDVQADKIGEQEGEIMDGIVVKDHDENGKDKDVGMEEGSSAAPKAGGVEWVSRETTICKIEGNSLKKISGSDKGIEWGNRRIAYGMGRGPDFQDIKAKINTILDGSGLAQEARRLFLAKSVVRRTRGHRAGKLDQGRLWKYKTSNKLFTAKEQPMLNMDTALSLMVDCSGSMGSAKYSSASAAAIMLSDALTPLGVNVETALFTEGDEYEGIMHGIVQQFKERVSRETLVERFYTGNFLRYQNADGDSLELAAYRIMQQKNQRKIIIVLSDGEPITDNLGNADAHLKKVVGDIEKDGVIELYAIGIESADVKRFYKNSAVLWSAAGLSEHLIGMLKNKLFS